MSSLVVCREKNILRLDSYKRCRKSKATKVDSTKFLLPCTCRSLMAFRAISISQLVVCHFMSWIQMYRWIDMSSIGNSAQNRCLKYFLNQNISKFLLSRLSKRKIRKSLFSGTGNFESGVSKLFHSTAVPHLWLGLCRNNGSDRSRHDSSDPPS